ncbi:MAG: stage III sporulation protein AF [Firmicutes bacterium]|nr:stage III sporulation protein AF [Bacillota bacterium]
MLAVLSDVVRNLVIFIIMVAVLELLLPRRDFRPFINMVVGLVLILMLLAPLRSLPLLPWFKAPMLEIREAVSQDDVAARLAELEQVNWEMTLARYRDLVKEKITALLQARGKEPVTLEFALEEDINHPQFGTPQKIFVLAREARQQPAGIVQPVEKVEIGPGTEKGEMPAGRRAPELEKSIAQALGVSQYVVEVWVFTE